MEKMRRYHSWGIGLSASVLFFLVGQLLIPLLGIEADEALFASPILEPKSWEYAIRIHHRQFALMLMSYLGTLKTLLYKPLLRWFGTGVWSVREPAVIAGAVSVWLFYLLLRRTVGERAAVVGCCLLAADTMYLLTSVFDWGPVALQHLLLTGGMLLLVRFYQQRSEGSLAVGSFLLGLALWDKALAGWMISGMGAAAVLLFWREIWRVGTPRRIGLAATAFLVGALPLIVYNRATHWNTFRGNVKADASELPVKREVLWQTIHGPGLLGLFTEESRRALAPSPPSGFFQSASASLAEATGHPVFNLIPYGLLLSVMLLPFTRGPDLRAALFAWIAMAIAWVQMILTYHAGGSVHHTILLWPLPYMALAVPLAAMSKRIGRAGMPALAAVTLVLAGSCALVTNEYYYRMARYGGSPAWSDAIFRLASDLKQTTAPVMYCIDWGIIDNLRLIGHGKLPVRDATEHLTPVQPTDADRAAVRSLLEAPGALFIGHTPEIEIFPGDRARLLQAATDSGLRREMVKTISDRAGRPTLEVYRFVAVPR